MSQSILQDPRLHKLLEVIDEELAHKAREGGCLHCSGRLDRANFKRKARGITGAGEACYESRQSFCCCRHGCRKRVTPTSVRFVPRRVYVSVVVVVATAMEHGVKPWRLSKLKQHLGVSRQTLLRWRAWWHSSFPSSEFWRTARGRFAQPVETKRLPASLLEQFVGSTQTAQLVRTLCFLASVPAQVMAKVSKEIEGQLRPAQDGI